MWNMPPDGMRRISDVTTDPVSVSTISRTRAELALCPPLTARKAFVIAIEIFDGSKPTTEPLRRITL